MALTKIEKVAEGVLRVTRKVPVRGTDGKTVEVEVSSIMTAEQVKARVAQVSAQTTEAQAELNQLQEALKAP
jgi:hypothetical protein